MVSNVRLAQIHLRLNEIFYNKKNSKNTFGNQNILLFGDLLQVKIFYYSNSSFLYTHLHFF